MSHDDGDEERRRCGICGRILRPYDSISLAEAGERCYRCFNEESAERLGVDFDAHDLFSLLRERIRQGLSVRHVQQAEHGWQLTPAHRLSGVIEGDAETEGTLPRLIVDGRTFTWDQIGRMLMTFEGFTLNAIVEDTIEVVGGPLVDGRLESQVSHESAPAVPTAVVGPLASNRTGAKKRRPTRSWPPSPRRLDALIEEATVDAYGESEQTTAFLTVLEERLALPFGATVLGEAVVVDKIDPSDADELIAVCRRRGKRQKVRLLDLKRCPPPGGRRVGRGVPTLGSAALARSISAIGIAELK